MTMSDKYFEQLKKNLSHHYRMVGKLQKEYRSETGQDFLPSGIGTIETPICRRGCEVYIPDYAPEVEVYYKATDHDIGPEIHDIAINGQEVSETVYSLLDSHDFELEIDSLLRDEAREAEEYKLIENFEIFRML